MRQTKFLISCLILILVTFYAFSSVHATIDTAYSFILYFPYGKSFLIQKTIPLNMTINVITGELSSTTASIIEATDILGSWRITFVFIAILDTSISIQYNNVSTIIYFNGATVNDNQTMTIIPSQEITIVWLPNTSSAFIPFGFIMGITGLGCLFLGPYIMITSAKEHDYDKAITVGFIVLMVGFALFMGWVYG